MDINGRNFKKFLERQKAFESQYDSKSKQKQHAKGKLTARERIDILFDEGTFEEIDGYVRSAKADGDFGKVFESYGDGVIIGHGLIHDRLVFAYAQDFNIMGGSLGSVHAAKIMKIQDMALKMGAPIIGLIDSGGARIQEGVASLAGYAGIFYRNVQASGVIPQISVVLGPAAGGAVYSPSITDFVFMTNKTSYMFVTGPNVVKEVLNEDVSFDDLGGAEVHAKKSGVAQMIFEDEENTLMGVRRMISYLPSNNLENCPETDLSEDETPDVNEKLRDIVPDDPNKPYDVKDVIELLVDKRSFYEISERFAQNIVIGFGRMDGKVIGIIANQPKVLAGTLDIDSSNKAARFVRFCDSFNIPLLTLEDVPGFLPGLDHSTTGSYGMGLSFYMPMQMPPFLVLPLFSESRMAEPIVL